MSSPLAIRGQAYFTGLAGLRGVGAMWVFIFHLKIAMSDKSVPIVSAGYIGVDLFFLLSGFVLSHTCRRTDGWTLLDYRRFIQARVARIFPLHLFTLLVLLLIVLAWPGFAASFPDGAERFSAGAFVANALLIQNWEIWPPFSWNTPAWSLSAEWFGYLVLPAAVALTRRVGGVTVAAALCYACLVVLILVLALRGEQTIGALGRLGFVRMACEMACGCFLYRAFSQGWRVGNPGGLAGSCLFALGILLPHADEVALLAIPLVVLGAAEGGTVLSRALSSRPLVFLGEISFSIYPTHWIILEAVHRALPPTAGLADPATTLRIAAIGLLGGILQLTTVSQIAVFGVPADITALLAVSIGLLEDHMNHCVVDAARVGDAEAREKVAEATEAIARLVRS